MYLKFYNLKSEPFSLSPDPSFLYMSEVHEEGLANLRYGLIQKKGFVVITGEVGTGKTTLINVLLSEIPQEVKAVYLSNPQLKRDEFFSLLSNEFELGKIKNKAEFLVKFTQFLEKANHNRKNVVLIIDEAHCLPEDLLEEVRLLSNLETPNSKLFNIILVGQPELENMLANPRFRALNQRVTLKHKLKPLNKKETREYIQMRLGKAGATDIGIFDSSALNSIYDYSRGIPRVINLLADRSMLTGFVKESKKIDDKIVKESALELGLDKNENRKIRINSEQKKKRRKNSKILLKVSLIIIFLILILVVGYFCNFSYNKQDLISFFIKK